MTDGSELIAISARWFIRCPAWEGQRTMDMDHVRELTKNIQNPRELEGPYTVCVIPADDGVRFGIVDGQHRAEVLREWFVGQPQSMDFMVLVRLVQCASDMEVITLFRKLNSSKPMKYELSAEEKQHEMVRMLVDAFRKKDVKGHKITEMIRSGARQRPYLATETLLHEIRARRFFHEGTATEHMSVTEVVDWIQTWNAGISANPNEYLMTLKGLTPALKGRAVGYSFYLGLDPALKWLSYIKFA